MMRSIMKFFILAVMASCLLLVLAYSAYLKRDNIVVWLGLEEPKPELSATPLFKPMERLVISLDGGAESRYLVLELALVTHNKAHLDSLSELTPLIRNIMVQYFSYRTHDDVKKELQNITSLQEALLVKLVTTLQGYGYKTDLDEVLVTNFLVQ